jgi:tetratricopeptide (TPR) repeat protein
MLSRANRIASPVLLALTMTAAAAAAPAQSADAASYRDAIAQYRSGERDRAIDVLLSMTDRQLLRESNRLERGRISEMTPAQWPDWTGDLRGAILLHTEVWTRQDPFRAPANVHDQISRRLAGVLLSRTTETRRDELNAAREFVRDWHLLVASQLHALLRIDDSRPRLEEARRQFPDDARLLLASGADHEALSAATAGWRRLRNSTGQPLSQERVNTTRELQRASEFYIAALQVEPALEEARLRLGRVLHRLGDADTAHGELALVHTTTAVPVVKYLAAVFLALVEVDAAQYERARELYAEAASTAPWRHAVLLGMSELAYRTGRPADAADLVRELLRGDDQYDPWWHYIQGTAWHRDALHRSLVERVHR